MTVLNGMDRFHLVMDVVDRGSGGNVLLFGDREALRFLAVRWPGLSPIEGRHLLLATASLSILGYHHSLTEPAIRAWNGRVTPAASAQ